MTDFTPAVTGAERDARDFAEAFPTPNVLRAIAHAERGDVAWTSIAALFARAASAGIDAVSA